MRRKASTRSVNGCAPLLLEQALQSPGAARLKEGPVEPALQADGQVRGAWSVLASTSTSPAATYPPMALRTNPTRRSTAPLGLLDYQAPLRELPHGQRRDPIGDHRG